MKSKIVLKLGVILLFLLTINVNVNAAIYYVATSGSDANNGSIDSPWATISYAVKNSGHGDTVYLRGGTYNETVGIRGHEGRGGSNGNFWTLQAYPGETATVTGDIALYMASYTRIKGLRVENGTIYNSGWVETGFSFPHHNEILNNTVGGTQQRYNMIGVIGDDNLVEGNTIIITGGGDSLDHGIYVMSGSGNTIRNNYISGAAGFGIHLYDEVKQGRSGIIDNVIIEKNIIYSSTSGGIIAASGASTDANATSNIIIRNNIIITSGIRGIEVRQNTKNIYIYNNTIYRNGGNSAGIRIAICCGSYGYIDNVAIKNNIVDIGDSSDYHINKGSSGTVSNLTVENNLYWSGSPKLNNVSDPNSVTADPLFVNPSAGDFTLQSASPAIDAGSSDVAAVVTQDYDGNTRPIGAGYDIGAYEVVDANAPVVQITLPTADNKYPSSGTFSGTLDLGGTATPSSGRSISSVTCSNSAGGNCSCQNTTSWTCNTYISSDQTNVNIKVTATDSNNSSGIDVLVVNYSASSGGGGGGGGGGGDGGGSGGGGDTGGDSGDNLRSDSDYYSSTGDDYSDLGSGSGNTQISGGGCGFVKDDNGKGPGADGGAATFAIMMMLTLFGIALAKRLQTKGKMVLG